MVYPCGERLQKRIGDFMNQNDIKFNASGYRDKVAETAIRKVDRTSLEIAELVDVIKKISKAYGYDVEGRITFRKNKTNMIYE